MPVQDTPRVNTLTQVPRTLMRGSPGIDIPRTRENSPSDGTETVKVSMALKRLGDFNKSPISTPLNNARRTRGERRGKEDVE